MYWSRKRSLFPFQSEDEKKNLAKILELWESYCLGKTNIIYERYRFNNRSQDAGESIDTYASSLRSLSDTRNFGTLKEEMIRDRIVCGVRNSSLRKKLLQVPALTIEKCINMCRSAEATSTQLEAMSAQNSHAPPPPEVNFIKKPSKGANKSSFVKCSIAVKHTWHTCENAMNLWNSCDNVITYANLKTVFKAKRAQIM